MAGRAKEYLPGGSLKYQVVYLKIRIFRCSNHMLTNSPISLDISPYHNFSWLNPFKSPWDKCHGLASHNREDFVTYVMAAPGFFGQRWPGGGNPETGCGDIHQRYSIKICYDCDGNIMGISWRSFAKERRESQLDTTENEGPRRASMVYWWEDVWWLKWEVIHWKMGQPVNLGKG